MLFWGLITMMNAGGFFKLFNTLMLALMELFNLSFEVGVSWGNKFVFAGSGVGVMKQHRLKEVEMLREYGRHCKQH